MLPLSVCAIADNKSTDNVWFVQIIGEFNSPENVIDDYSHTASAGKKYMPDYFLQQVHDQVYPFVKMSEINGHYITSSKDFVDIVNYVEHYALAIL